MYMFFITLKTNRKANLINVQFVFTFVVVAVQTNSFQMILATDEVFTYAIFNYIDINWSSHTEAGGDTTGGEGGVPAYVSFITLS